MVRILHYYLLTVLLVTLSIVTSQAQDPVFSQFYAAPLQLNPALTGITYSPRIILNYRNQWPSLNNAYVTYGASYDQYFDKIKSGIGLSVLSDVAGNGVYKTNKISALYSYSLPITKSLFIKGGLEATFNQSRVDWDQLVFLDQLDPLSGVTDPSGNPISSEEQRPENLGVTYMDFSAGLLLYNEMFYGGLTLKHINAPNESILDNNSLFATVPIRISVHGGAQISLTKETRSKSNKSQAEAFLSPNLTLIKQAEFYQVNLGAYARYNFIFGGLWYRHTFSNPDAVILLLGVQKGVIKIGYSYDVTVSKLNTIQTGGAHEASVIINFDNNPTLKNRRNKRRYNDCFKMFR